MTFLRLTTSAALFLIAVAGLANSSSGEDSKPDAPPVNEWSYVGCFSDIASQRTLTQFMTTNSRMTPQVCNEYCQGTLAAPKDFNFAGVEYTSECYCGYSIDGKAVQLNETSCNYPCGGDSTLICGGAAAIGIYQLNSQVPANKATVGNWTFQGCHKDAVEGNARTLTERFDISNGVTIESCTTKCESAGYNITGLEFGQECWCGSSFQVEDTTAPLGDCSQACDANHKELCGNSYRLSVYQIKGKGTKR